MIPKNWAEKPPHPHPPTPRMRENFLTSDLSISGNFEQLWFLCQKSPPPLPGWGKIFWLQIYPFQGISSNFGFCGRKAPPPRMRENFLTSDLSISGNFKQLWFLWQKSPPPQDEGKFFDFRCIHFRQFQDQPRVTQVEYPRSPYYKSILRFLLSEYLL